MNNFSPIAVKRSPVDSTPGKNLTGIPRIVSDIVADIYNVIQKWNSYHLKGIEVLREIVSFMPRDYDMDLKMQDDLNNLTLELFNLSIVCSEVVNNVDSFCKRISAMIKIHGEEIQPFISMPLGKIQKIGQLIYEAYAKELKNKKLVLENIAFSKSESEAIFYACLWKYQIHIDMKVHMNVEILLTETGHRKIT